MREVVGTSDLQPIIGPAVVAKLLTRAEAILQETLDLYESGIQIVGLQPAGSLTAR
jgi:membrane protease subunit HflK